MKIFIICPVRNASQEVKDKLEMYVNLLENQGHTVHLPHRDTKQDARGIEICTENARAIGDSDEVHIFYTNASTGTHFDMGVSFALGKKIYIVDSDPVPAVGKSFSKMLVEWAEEGAPTIKNKTAKTGWPV